ncbi:Hypothetical predicted protein [Podarcis lilfordi]|uniref:Uncharacterized protein n=1 Tax=Podarcis lilfordi TaxID=74358 RepID=A0AA35LMQ0_9SAUR|nr:Hypothetical predicted protein [Podarcis lilfordi]
MAESFVDFIQYGTGGRDSGSANVPQVALGTGNPCYATGRLVGSPLPLLWISHGKLSPSPIWLEIALTPQSTLQPAGKSKGPAGFGQCITHKLFPIPSKFH